jgi:hypothetical protein
VAAIISQPAKKAEIRIDRAADPFEGGAAVGIPQIQPAIGVGDDDHGNGCEQDDRPDGIGSRDDEPGQGQPDR